MTLATRRQALQRIASSVVTAAAAVTVPERAARAQSAEPPTLAELLVNTNWNAATLGTLLVVDPEGASRDSKVPLPGPVRGIYTLRHAAPAYRRMLMPVGSVTVAAPTTVTLIDDTPRAKPNLYDGLPRPQKILYLMASLSQAQWKRVTEAGLGLADFSGEQRDVFLSLLPEPFQVHGGTVDTKGAPSREESFTLSPDERKQVRLRLQRRLDFEVPVLDRERTYATMFTSQYYGKPGATALWREDRADFDKKDAFGITFSKIVPNRPKPSDLDYAAAALDAPVSLRGVATVRDLVQCIATATKTELHADLRVAWFPVFVRGSQARAGDLLKALALSVGGTFRRVDTAFVLTADRIGRGTRQLRLAEWEADLRVEMRSREDEWIRAIVRANGAGALDYAPDDALAPSPDLLREIAARRNKSGPESEIAAALLPPEAREFLAQQDTLYNREKAGQVWRTDRVHVDTNLYFGFLLPDGRALKVEQPLGGLWRFEREPQSASADDEVLPPREQWPKGPFSLPAGPKRRSLFLTPTGTRQATQAVAAAKRHGFTELVLSSEDQEVLTAALQAGNAAGVAIVARVAPFAAPPDTTALEPDTLDRSLMGETAAEIVAVREKSGRWQQLLRSAERQTFPPPAPGRMNGVRSALAPTEKAMARRLAHLAALAKLPGLSGMAFYDTQPAGYAGSRSEASNSPAGERGNLGYIPALRLGFLRQEAIDPIDLIPSGLRIGADLRLPFFPDDNARASSSVYGARTERNSPPPGFEKLSAKWHSWRAQANRAALVGLHTAMRAAAPALPLLIESRPLEDNNSSPDRLRTFYATWTKPDALPVHPARIDVRPQGVAAEARLFHPLCPPDPTTPRLRFLTALTLGAVSEAKWGTAGGAPETLALDLSAFPFEKAVAFLTEWLRESP